MAKKADAERFVRDWRGRGNEDQDTQLFWIDLFQNVLGVEDALDRLRFEVPVSTAASDHKGFIDVLIPSAKVIVEQKSLGVDLSKPERRQGRMVTPAQQANGYIEGMGLAQQPRYVIACNFSEFWIYDRNIDSLFKEPMLKLSLDDLPKNLPALQFLKGSGEAPRSVQRAVSIEAGRIMGKIHNEISQLYHDPDSEESHHALSVLCTRLMFLMFCEDAGLIEPGLFREYVASVDGAHLRGALLELFQWLDTDDDARKAEYPSEILARFPYMNGGLFRERVQVPQLNDNVHYEILVNGCQEFDWSGVDPTVFGSIFEGALSHDTRRSGGMHYTSPENIHKVIDPLFLDDLKTEFDRAASKENAAARKRALEAFHAKIGSLTFLDPACGSGNFLTETYICLRRLENDVLIELQRLEAAKRRDVLEGQTGFDFAEDGTGDDLVKVSLANFHGIEINDFACCVARTALWIAEKQADLNTAKVVKRVYDELPLKEYGTIIHENSLRVDWTDACPAHRLSYIIGNPPFIGYSNLNADQKADRADIFGKSGGVLDYVACWYKKAADFTRGTHVRCAFVSTNSICQGQQVEPLWKPLFDDGVEIDFAHKTFVWNSEATDEAHVHVIIVGFSREECDHRRLFSEVTSKEVDNINGYLLDAPDVFVSKRSAPLSSGISPMVYGSKPCDGGFLQIKEEAYGDAMKDEFARPFIRKCLGATELINDKKRWCLWLEDAKPQDIARSPFIKERVSQCREWRCAQTKTGDAYKLKDEPHLFRQNDKRPKGTFLCVPRHFSGGRRFFTAQRCECGEIATDACFTARDDDGLQFSILSSSVFMAWQKAVGGELKSDCRFANTIVWNTFPLPDMDDSARRRILEAGRAVIEARKTYDGMSLADLYKPGDEWLYPVLFDAHKALDRAVEAAYGVDFNGDEEKMAAHLLKLYAERTAAQ